MSKAVMLMVITEMNPLPGETDEQMVARLDAQCVDELMDSMLEANEMKEDCFCDHSSITILGDTEDLGGIPTPVAVSGDDSDTVH